MSVMLLRQNVKPERVDDAEAAVRELFAALENAQPKGVRYASTRVEGSSTFVIMLELAEGADDPRSVIAEFPRFQQQLAELVEGPPVIEQLDVIGSYNLFGASRGAAATR